MAKYETYSSINDNQESSKYWYLRTIKELFKDLNSSKKGLSEKQVKESLELYGLNKIAEEEKYKSLKLFFKNFNSLLIYILLGAGIISLFSDHVFEFIIIALIILITGVSGFIQEYNAGKALDALSKLTVKYVEVMRNGIKKKINHEQLVVGDIVFIERGIIIPADMRIIEANNLSVNESILTGETVSKYKRNEVINKQEVFLTEQHNMIFSGSSVTNGHGIGIVVATGLNSEIGKISKTLRKIGTKISPLQKQVDKMGKKISFIVLFACIVLFSIMIFQNYRIYETLILISAVAVSGIPESFPLALTMSLSHGVSRMAKKNAIIKDLNSVETLGTCTVICTDKTGTLTENKMVAEKIYFANGLEINVKGNDYEPTSSFYYKNNIFKKENFQNHSDFFKACILCNNSDIVFNENTWELSGEATEGSLLTMAKSAGFEDKSLRETNKRLHEVPFDPFKKYMITVNKNPNSKTYNTAYLKGAVEKIVERCKFTRNKNGTKIKLNSPEIKKILHQVHLYTNKTYRVLAIASKPISKKANFHESKKGNNKLNSDYIFEGLIAIEDPIREEVYKAVDECKTANVKIVVITGDHKDTAMSVGHKLGLINSKKDLVMQGFELDKLTDEELDDIILQVSIFSRTTPHHKFRIVNALQKKGEVVAMTGDGVNDAPALKRADIGIAMGKTGTDVAREASNMILTDDNFATIVNTIKEGRTIYSNIRRFVYYLLTGNFTEVSLMLITAIFGIISPLTALMIIFINIVTSTFPSMALSIEPTHSKVMHQKPRNPKKGILSEYLLLKIFSVVPVLFLGTLGLFLYQLNILGAEVDKARTMAFALIIIFELLHTFNARSLHTTIFNQKFLSNKFVFLSVGLSFIFTVLAIHTKLGHIIFSTVALSGIEWLVIVIIALGVIFVSETIKALVNSELEEQKALKGSRWNTYN